MYKQDDMWLWLKQKSQQKKLTAYKINSCSDSLPFVLFDLYCITVTISFMYRLKQCVMFKKKQPMVFHWYAIKPESA